MVVFSLSDAEYIVISQQPHEFLDLNSAFFSHLFEALSTFDGFFGL